MGASRGNIGIVGIPQTILEAELQRYCLVDDVV